MNSKKFSEAMSELDNKYIDEAIHYKKKAKKPVWVKLGVVAACLALAIGSIFNPFHESMVVAAYAYGTDEEITKAGAVMNSGTINDKGEMSGHPLMFYLSGKGIETVRFSCKNQQINFMDWTEKRDEYGNAQNFTVPYGEDESDYYYLTIDWIPNTIIRELTDNAEATIATLPTEMREDIIVMEIAFANGKTATKAMTVVLLEDGTFFASFDDYEITAEDSFIKRIDSESIPRDILYEQGANAGQNNEQPLENVPSVDENDKKTDTDKPETDIAPDKQDTEQDEEEISGAAADSSLDTAKTAAQNYYANTVFEVVSMELRSQTEEEITFSVCVSKGGIVQEPNRTIFLQLVNGSWEVINEGY